MEELLQGMGPTSAGSDSGSAEFYYQQSDPGALDNRGNSGAMADCPAKLLRG